MSQGMERVGRMAGRIGRGGKLAAALALAGILGACTSDNISALLGPKEPNVPTVTPGQYPNLGTVAPDIARPPVLDAAGQARMESNLTNLGKQTQQKGEAAAAAAP